MKIQGSRAWHNSCTWACRNWRMRRKRTRMACLALRTRGLSQDQLHILLLNAFQSASDQMESLAHWTHQQAGTEMQYWKLREGKALVGDVSSWLVREAWAEQATLT